MAKFSRKIPDDYLFIGAKLITLRAGEEAQLWLSMWDAETSSA